MLAAAQIGSPGTHPLTGALHRVRRALPRGTPLPDDVWRRRHETILMLLWLHAAGITGYGLIVGYGLAHSLAEGALIAVLAAIASAGKGTRTARAVIASLGLLTSSALLVHLSGGYIELHFHFFVMVAVITLYQDWVPFLAAIGFVVLEHGLGGILYPTAVYNHPDAWSNPWKWAVIHGVFVLGASAAAIANWRLNEGARARTTSILNSVGEGIVGLDGHGRATFVNPAALTMTGCTASELIDRHLDELVHLPLAEDTADSSTLDRNLPALTDDTTYHLGEGLLRRKDGSKIPVEYLITPIRDFGEVVGAVVTFRDISARERAEEALRESNRRLAAVVAELQETQKQVVQQDGSGRWAKWRVESLTTSTMHSPRSRDSVRS